MQHIHIQFMVRALHNGDNMEIFIEGSRSRSGKASSPKAGLLSVLVDTVKEGEQEGGRGGGKPGGWQEGGRGGGKPGGWQEGEGSPVAGRSKLCVSWPSLISQVWSRTS